MQSNEHYIKYRSKKRVSGTGSTVAAEWNKTPTMMTYTRNTYTAEAMAEKLKAGSWSSFVIKSAGGKKSKRGKNDPSDDIQPCYFMALDGEHKYIRYIYPDRIEELYDLEKDPDELNNLSLKPELQEKVVQMRGELIAYLKKTGGETFVDLLPEPKSASEYLANPPSTTAQNEKAPGGSKLPGDTTVYSIGGKGRVHVDGCRRLTNDPAERAKMTKMTLAEAEAKGTPLCSRCPVGNAPDKESSKTDPAEKPSEDSMVFHVEGKKRVHVDGCKRLSNDPAERAKMTKMTLAEAEAKGLPLCSKCPGSTTE